MWGIAQWVAAVMAVVLFLSAVGGILYRNRLLDEAADNFKALEAENERLLLELDMCHTAIDYFRGEYPCCFQCDEPDVTKECYWP